MLVMHYVVASLLVMHYVVASFQIVMWKSYVSSCTAVLESSNISVIIFWSWNLFADRAPNATLKCSCLFSHSHVTERGRWFRGLVQSASPPPTASVAASKFSTVRRLVNPQPGLSIGLNAHLPRYVKYASMLLFFSCPASRTAQRVTLSVSN